MAVYAGEGDLVATGSTDNTLRLWDLRSHRCIDVVMVGDSSPASAALSSNGSYLASGTCLIFIQSICIDPEGNSRKKCSPFCNWTKFMLKFPSRT